MYWLPRMRFTLRMDWFSHANSMRKSFLSRFAFGCFSYFLKSFIILVSRFTLGRLSIFSFHDYVLILFSRMIYGSVLVFSVNEHILSKLVFKKIQRMWRTCQQTCQNGSQGRLGRVILEVKGRMFELTRRFWGLYGVLGFIVRVLGSAFSIQGSVLGASGIYLGALGLNLGGQDLCFEVQAKGLYLWEFRRYYFERIFGNVCYRENIKTLWTHHFVIIFKWSETSFQYIFLNF